VYDSAGQLAWALAVADVNGDGKPDIVEVNYTGTTSEGVVGVLLNQGKGSFRPAVTYDSGGIEGISVAIADLNHDGKPDIIVANGSDGVTGRIQIGVLMGNGDGTFQNAVKYGAGGAALGIGGLSTIPFTVTDVNGDGKPDLVVDNQGTDYNGGDGLVGVLLGNGDGTFKPVLVYDTGASWLTSIALADFNKDGKLDVVGTNCYVTDGFFCSAPQSTVSVGLGDGDGTFRHIATLDKGGAGDGGSPVVVADLNHDGNPDIIAGNLGLNNPFHISAQQPAEMIAKDFDGNGIVEPIFCYYIKDNEGEYQLSAGISRDLWAKQMPSIKKNFDKNEPYARASMDAVFPKEMMKDAAVLECKEVRSGYFENDGKGRFNFHPFSAMAQIAPVNAIVCTDVNGDGIPDIILAGNEYQASVATGRYDASYGLLLTGNRKGGFDPVSPVSSGLIIDGDIKNLAIITTATRRILLAAVNDDKMKAYAIRKK